MLQLLYALRRIGLHDTDFAQATCGTIRLKLLKIGALVRISVRRIKIAMASACPAARDWGRAAVRLAIPALAAPRRHETPRRGAIIARQNPQAHRDPENINYKSRPAAPRICLAQPQPQSNPLTRRTIHQ